MHFSNLVNLDKEGSLKQCLLSTFGRNLGFGNHTTSLPLLSSSICICRVLCVFFIIWVISVSLTDHDIQEMCLHIRAYECTSTSEIVFSVCIYIYVPVYVTRVEYYSYV